MANSIVPLMLLGVGVFVLQRHKRPSPSPQKGEEPEIPLVPIHTVVFIPPSTGSPQGGTGQPCAGGHGPGALDELGECRTFWIDGATDDAIATLAREEWELRGRPEFSQMCLMVHDPLEEFDEWKANPVFESIVVACLRRYYDVGPLFPPVPVQNGVDESSPYWVHAAWMRASEVVRKELCTP